MRSKITLAELGSFLGVAPETIKSVHSNANKGAFIEVEVFVMEPNPDETSNTPFTRVKTHRNESISHTLRIALVN